MTGPWRTTAAMRLLAAVLACALSGHARAQIRLSSSDSSERSHAWGVYENAHGDILLVHIPPRDIGAEKAPRIEPALAGELRAVRTLSRFPDAIAAREDKVFLVFPTAYAGGDRIRRVFSGRIIASPVGGAWTFSPVGRLDAEPAIRSEGELVGFVATGDALWALLEAKDGFNLLTMRDGQWASTPLPAPPSTNAPRWTISEVDSTLVALDLAQAGRITPMSLDGSTGEWSALDWPKMDWSPAPEPAGSAQILPGEHGLLVVDHDERGGTRISSASRSGFFTIASGLDLPVNTSFAALRSANRLVGLAEQPQLARGDGDQQPASPAPDTPKIRIFEIDLSDGSILYAGEPQVPVPVSAGELRFLIGMMVLVMLGVLIVVVMPDRSASLQVPDGFSLADPGRRLIASLLDVLLVAYAVGALLDVHVSEILTLSVIVRSDSAWMALPMTLVLGALLMSVSEWSIGGSPGKLLTGLRVARAQPGPMRRIPLWAALVRNAIKWLLPPAAALAMVDPEMLHRGDRATRTLVVTPVRNPDPDSVPNQGAQQDSDPGSDDEA